MSVDEATSLRKRSSMRNAYKLSLLLTLAGCATTGEVTPMGRDTYMVSTSSLIGMESMGSLAASNAKKADAYCVAMGKEMVPTNLSNSGLRGITPTEAEFTFRCVPPVKPAKSATPQS